MAESFYGGVNGQSFEIKKTFDTRVDMEKDLASRWASPVSVGEYVAISYGLPHEKGYETKRDTDLAADFDGDGKSDQKSYNFTLWQKSYDDKLAESKGNGLYYKLILSTTGFTPRITTSFELAGADKEPFVIIDPKNVDAPNFHFRLPAHWEMRPAALKPEQAPVLEVIKEEDGKTLFYPYLKLSLPNPWQFEYDVAEDYEVLHANEEPTAQVIKDFDAETVTFKFALPRAERIKVELDPVPLDAGQAPQISYDTSNPDEPVATLKLPRMPVFADPETEIAAPAADPAVEFADSSTDNAPKLHFTLPRTAKWYFGTLIDGNDPVVPYYVTGLAGFAEGDMYVNSATGYFYESVAKDDGDTNPGVKVYYRGCFQTPKPEVEATGISPYEEQADLTFAPAKPTVTPTVSATGWDLEFGIPKAPIPQVDVIYISSEDAGAGDVTPNGENTIKFTLNIPAGTRVIPGTEVDDDHISTVVAGARKGDIYLNTLSGKYYKLDGNDEWVLQGSLIGPTGAALNVIEYLTIDESVTARADIPAAIGEALSAAGKTASAEAIVAVSLTNLADEEESFWYVYVDNTWQPLSLTGGVGSSIRRYSDGYLDSDDTVSEDKVYSVKYINSIIGGEKTNTNKAITAYSKEQVYTTDETYNKDELYNKTQVYTKAEIDALLNTWGTFDDIEEE